MSDNYQAIYDAVRSRIGRPDVDSAVERVLRDAFGSADRIIRCAAQELATAGEEMQRPSAIFRPRLFIDGDRWCALYGDNIQRGVVGFGYTPDVAMRSFDHAWIASTNAKREVREEKRGARNDDEDLQGLMDRDMGRLACK